MMMQKKMHWGSQILVCVSRDEKYDDENDDYLIRQKKKH